MRILPVLFNTDMVQAIQDDRKTVTRRCLKHPFTVHPNGYITKPRGNENLCPYEPPYRKGDVLWVRETWSTRQSNECIENTTGRCPYDSCETAPGPCFDKEYIYKATDSLDSSVNKWHPSIHMPKSAARIFLKVTDVGIERLQNMTLDDFLKEGISIPYEAFNDPENAYMQAKEIFMHIWDLTINKTQRHLYGWDANPLVWVIEFVKWVKPTMEADETL